MFLFPKGHKPTHSHRPSTPPSCRFQGTPSPVNPGMPCDGRLLSTAQCVKSGRGTRTLMACGRNVWNRILATKGILPILLGVYRIFGQRDINATPIDMNDVHWFSISIGQSQWYLCLDEDLFNCDLCNQSANLMFKVLIHILIEDFHVRLLEGKAKGQPFYGAKCSLKPKGQSSEHSSNIAVMCGDVWWHAKLPSAIIGSMVC